MKTTLPVQMTFCGAVLLLSVGVTQAASPSAAEALKLAPIQKGVDYDQPSADDAAKCTITARKLNGKVGWVVEAPSGTVLREFVDTNGDNIVDEWSYFKDGLEVYRDIDADFNRKAEQSRWFHTAGSRWGVDKDEDGVIDGWKAISAEEVTAEVVAALATKDKARFSRLLLGPAELKSLGLGDEKVEELGKRLAAAEAEFAKLADEQKALGPDAKWLQFSASGPGVVPSGTHGSTEDIRVYENVAAIVESGGKTGEVLVGTLVQVGDGWRVIGAPRLAADGPGRVRRRDSSSNRRSAPIRVRPPVGKARPARSFWPRSRASTRRCRRPPRPRKGQNSTPSGPTWSRRWPRRPTAPTSGRCGFASWPTRSARRCSRGPIPRASNGSASCSTSSPETSEIGTWRRTSGSGSCSPITA